MICNHCNRIDSVTQIAGGVFICECRKDFFRAALAPQQPEAPATVDHATEIVPVPQETMAGATLLDFPDTPKILRRRA